MSSSAESGLAARVAWERAGVQPRLGAGFVATYAFAYAGAWLALLTPILVTLALRIRELAPQTAAQDLSLVLGVGAVFALIGNPLFGRLSDRTTSRFGMRRPWLAAGVICGCAALLLIAKADSVSTVLVGWCLAQLAYNAVLSALIAVLPDQAPPEQRGTVSGVLGICMPIGQAGGTFLVAAVAGSMTVAFMAPALLGAVGVLALVFVLPDRRLPRAQAPRLDWRELVRAYWVNPRVHSDFAWAWLSRLLLVLGTAFLNTYQPFYLMDKLGFAAAQAPTLIFKATLVQAVLIIGMSVLGGWLSDHVRRRKAFVFAGGVLYACGLTTIALAGSYETFLVGMALTGAGHGVYFAVDLALVSEVLPNSERDAGKDMGVLNMANALPQSIAPALAPLILALGGGDYAWVFLAAAAAALGAAFAILPIRRAK